MNCKQLLKNYCWLWTKKVTNFKAHKKKVTQLGPTASGLIGPAPSIKIEVQTHFDSIWLYPFSWMFSLWLYFYFCQVAIFWLKKVQFSSQKCNFYLWKILHCNFWKQERKKNYSKQQKCYTTSLRILSPKQNEFFVGLF